MYTKHHKKYLKGVRTSLNARVYIHIREITQKASMGDRVGSHVVSVRIHCTEKMADFM